MGNSSQCVQAMKSGAIITRYKDQYICTKCIFSGYRYIEKLNKGVDCILIYVNARFPLTQYGILQRKNKWMYWSLTKELIKGGHQHTYFEFNILPELILDFDTPHTALKRNMFLIISYTTKSKHQDMSRKYCFYLPNKDLYLGLMRTVICVACWRIRYVITKTLKFQPLSTQQHKWWWA